LVLSAIAFTMPAVVYYVNPDNKFHGEAYSKRIAEQLLRNKNITGTVNFERRVIFKYYIDGLGKIPDGVVFGSSRVMMIDSTFFPNPNIFVLNCGVNSATLEDEMAIYDMFVKRGWYPKQIILGIDPYYFNDNNPQKLYGPIRTYYYDMCSRIGSQIPKDKEIIMEYGLYKDLFNPYCFQKSLLYWVGTGNNHSYTVTDNKYNDQSTIMPNGCISYSKAQREWSQAESDEFARSYLSDEVVYYKNFTRISPSISDKLEKFIDYLKSKGVNVSILYEPYHPICYQQLVTEPQYKIAVTTENYCRQLALKKKISFFGSLNPAYLGLNNSDFYDGAHLRGEAVRKVLKGTPRLPS